MGEVFIPSIKRCLEERKRSFLLNGAVKSFNAGIHFGGARVSEEMVNLLLFTGKFKVGEKFTAVICIDGFDWCSQGNLHAFKHIGGIS